jgi:hypothetical protein
MQKRTESGEQQALFQWAKLNENIYPALKGMYHIPNAGKRSPVAGRKMVFEGLKKGVPDICLPYAANGYSALYIELKVGKNKPTKAQNEYMEILRELGNRVEVCYGYDAAKSVIKKYIGEKD